MVGKSLSHYKILGELGRGGMGIVYKAEDTKLDRTVAIKVLPSAALASEDDRARFYREAKAAAQLHHPHIASVFEIDEAVPRTVEEITRSEIDEAIPEGSKDDDLRPFIAMEFIEGKTLDEKIKEGPLKLKDTVRIASEIASALEVAHKKEIVHRDIKSQNVMLTEEGVAKVLDFGLAQTAQSTKLTRMGSTLGTIAYMSPEQARSEDVDGRTDIWSLGVVLYEMIAGRHPFPGDYEQAAVYSILNEDPEPLTAVRTGVPMELEWLVNKCLAKNANERYQAASELIVDLKAIDLNASESLRASHYSQVRSADVSTAEPTQSKQTIGLTKLQIVAGILLILVVGYLGARIIEPAVDTPDFPVLELELPLPAGQSLWSLDLSPDGTYMAYVTNDPDRPLYRFDFETGEVRFIEGGIFGLAVKVSPDGQWLLLLNRYSISRISVNGGSALPVISTEEFPDAAWGRDSQTVLYSTGRGISSVALSSGEQRILTRLDSLRDEVNHDGPSILPDGRTLMFSIRTTSGVNIGFADVESGQRLSEIAGGAQPRYVKTGHVLYLDENQVLIALPFDVKTLSPLSAPVAVRQPSDVYAWAISENGILVNIGERLKASRRPLIRFMASGEADTLDFGDATHDNMSLSPDGTMMAVQAGQTQERDVWVYELNTGAQIPMTTNGQSYSPSWSPDGSSIVYVSGSNTIAELPIDGSSSRREIYSGSGAIDYPSWSPDGRLLAFDMDGDIWLFDAENGARPFMTTSAKENQGRFSPDGRYLALAREVDGAAHVFVHSLDDPSIAWDVSNGIGFDPYWSDDGKTIYFRNFSSVVRRSVSSDPNFRLLGNPEIWLTFISVSDYAVLPDESGIIQAVPMTNLPNERTRLQVTVNFFDQLKRLAPRPD